MEPVDNNKLYRNLPNVRFTLLSSIVVDDDDDDNADYYKINNFIYFQVSTTKQICITFCTDKYELYELMRFIMIFYKIILLIFLLYLSYKNSKIPTRFQEEGQAGIRMVLAVIILSIVFIIIYILSLSISYKATYWTAYMYTTFAPVVYLAAILLPKVSGNHIFLCHEL